MARKSNPDLPKPKSVLVRFSEEEYSVLKETAQELNRSINSLVRDATSAYTSAAKGTVDWQTTATALQSSFQASVASSGLNSGSMLLSRSYSDPTPYQSAAQALVTGSDPYAAAITALAGATENTEGDSK